MFSGYLEYGSQHLKIEEDLLRSAVTVSMDFEAQVENPQSSDLFVVAEGMAGMELKRDVTAHDTAMHNAWFDRATERMTW